jgi:hypothetical protein
LLNYSMEIRSVATAGRSASFSGDCSRKEERLGPGACLCPGLIPHANPSVEILKKNKSIIVAKEQIVNAHVLQEDEDGS